MKSASAIIVSCWICITQLEKLLTPNGGETQFHLMKIVFPGMLKISARHERNSFI